MAGTASARSENLEHVITFDIGGTSCDVSTIEGKNPSLKDHFEIGRYKVMSPSVEVETIGAGGGSIASVDQLMGNVLSVGPRSAGSMPGPDRWPLVTRMAILLGLISVRTITSLELCVRNGLRVCSRLASTSTTFIRRCRRSARHR